MPVSHFPWFNGHSRCPNLLPRPCRIAARVRDFTASVRVVAARKEEAAAIRTPGDLTDFLAIVSGEPRYLHCLITGRARDTDISDTGGILDPRERVAFGRCPEAIRKRSA